MELADAFGLIYEADDAIDIGHPMGKTAWVAAELADNAGYLDNLAEQQGVKVQELHLRDAAMHLGMARQEFNAGDYREAVRLALAAYPSSLNTPAFYLGRYADHVRGWPADEIELMPTPKAVTAAYLFICEHNLNKMRDRWQNPSSRRGAAPPPAPSP